MLLFFFTHERNFNKNTREKEHKLATKAVFDFFSLTFRHIFFLSYRSNVTFLVHDIEIKLIITTKVGDAMYFIEKKVSITQSGNFTRVKTSKYKSGPADFFGPLLMT
jgi:hypothetical protein